MKHFLCIALFIIGLAAVLFVAQAPVPEDASCLIRQHHGGRFPGMLMKPDCSDWSR